MNDYPLLSDVTMEQEQEEDSDDNIDDLIDLRNEISYEFRFFDK